MVAVRRGGLHGVEHLADLLLHQVAQALAMPRARAHRGDDAPGGGKTYVRRHEQLFERFDGVDVDRPRALFRGVGLLDDFLEAGDDLLFGTRQAVAQLVEKSH